MLRSFNVSKMKRLDSPKRKLMLMNFNVSKMKRQDSPKRKLMLRSFNVSKMKRLDWSKRDLTQLLRRNVSLTSKTALWRKLKRDV
jgi:hypothetical protein